MQSQHSYLPLAGKTAVVTGASRGIGAGIALELATQGANVLVTYTSPSSTDLVASLIKKVKDLENGSRAIGIRADLRDPTSMDLIIGKSAEFGGPKLENGKAKIDVLVNNVGVELVRHLGSITPEDFESVYNLNVRGTLLMTQAVLPHLPAAGRVINVSSVGARCGFPGLSVYCSSKAAIEGLTRCWATELGKNGTTVNCVNPGPVQTELMENIPKDIVEQQKANTPIEKRLGSVDDVAKNKAQQALPWNSAQSTAGIYDTHNCSLKYTNTHFHTLWER